MTRIVILPIVAAGLIVVGVVVAVDGGVGERRAGQVLQPGDRAERGGRLLCREHGPDVAAMARRQRLARRHQCKTPLRELLDEALAKVNLDWEDDILPIAGIGVLLGAGY